MWIVGLTIVPVVLGLLLLPPADYLPEGKRNNLFGFLQTPPGMGPDTAEAELIGPINERLLPYIRGEKQPEIANNFLGYFGSGSFLGMNAVNIRREDTLLNLVNKDRKSG